MDLSIECTTRTVKFILQFLIYYYYCDETVIHSAPISESFAIPFPIRNISRKRVTEKSKAIIGPKDNKIKRGSRAS